MTHVKTRLCITHWKETTTPKPLETVPVQEEKPTVLAEVPENKPATTESLEENTGPVELAQWGWKLMIGYMKRAKSGESC